MSLMTTEPSPEPSPGATERVAAFFDLDLTLILVNSGRLWVARERRLGRITGVTMARATLYFLLYRLGLLNMDKALDMALSHYRGVPEERLRDWTREWFHEEVARHVAPGSRPVIEAHRSRGDLLVLLTLSSPYEAAAAAEHMGLDHVLSTRYEVRDGLLTGKAIPPICYGAGKVVASEAFAARHGVDLARSTFYTDSISDLPMMERVGHPVAVNPDPRLRRLARGRGWPVLDWSRG